MPPVTQLRQCSTNLGSTSSWGPYSADSALERKTTISKPAHSPTLPSMPSALSGLKVSTSSRIPSPIVTSLAPEDPDLRGMSGATVSELLEHGLNADRNRNTILLLDMRPSGSHTAASINTAVRVSIPSILLKRPMYTLSMMTEQLTTPREIETFSNWRRFSNIVLFDATGSTPVKGSPIFCIAQKFRKEGCVARLGYIHGGYNAFEHEHGSLCCRADNVSTFKTPDVNDQTTTPPTTATSKVPPLRCRLHLGALPSTAKALRTTADSQTPMTENANVNPLFESVRQAMGLNTHIAEEVPIRLPPNVPIGCIQDKLPSWLLGVIDSKTGKTRLAEYFQVPMRTVVQLVSVYW
ncbi:hypothetical protein B0O80DRAFT_206813 [Mortierella sp. GBAus27b]|nr:hypothetical protein B0O80DRAFT_206813 [Mortierella sp. GBAus27b]